MILFLIVLGLRFLNYKIEIETIWNILFVRLHSFRKDKIDFTPEQMTFVKGYSDGHTQVMNMIWKEIL